MVDTKRFMTSIPLELQTNSTLYVCTRTVDFHQKSRFVQPRRQFCLSRTQMSKSDDSCEDGDVDAATLSGRGAMQASKSARGLVERCGEHDFHPPTTEVVHEAQARAQFDTPCTKPRAGDLRCFSAPRALRNQHAFRPECNHCSSNNGLLL